MAEKFFTSIIVYLKATDPSNAFNIFYFSLHNLRPLVFLRPVKVGSTFYKTPAPIDRHHRRLFAIKFIFQAARDNKGKITVKKMGDLILSIYSGEKNLATEKKFEFYREAFSNRSFIRFIKYEPSQKKF